MTKNLLIICFVVTQVMGMEHAAPLVPLTQAKHDELVAFACEMYPRYGIGGIPELFTECASRYPDCASLAQMYVYFQVKPNERHVQERFFERLNVQEFLECCPSFHFCGADAGFVCFLDLLRRREGFEQSNRTGVVGLFNYLIVRNHIPFLLYLGAMLRSRNFELGPEEIGLTQRKLFELCREAIWYNSAAVACVCIDWYGLDPNYESEDKNTLLAQAIARGKIEIVRSLLAHKAKINVEVKRLIKAIKKHPLATDEPRERPDARAEVYHVPIDKESMEEYQAIIKLLATYSGLPVVSSRLSTTESTGAASASCPDPMSVSSPLRRIASFRRNALMPAANLVRTAHSDPLPGSTVEVVEDVGCGCGCRVRDKTKKHSACAIM